MRRRRDWKRGSERDDRSLPTVLRNACGPFLIPSQDCESRLEYVVDELGSTTEGRDFSYGRRHEFSAANREEE